MGRIRRKFVSLLGLILPERCLVCRRTVRGSKLCARCIPPSPRRDLGCSGCGGALSEHGNSECPACRHFPLPFRIAGTLWNYEDRVQDFVRAMKYRPSRWLCLYAGRLLARAAVEHRPGREWDLIATVPSSLESRVRRGFNQCDLIARPVCRALALPFVPGALESLRSKSRQAGKRATARLSGMGHPVFEANPELVCDQRVLLIDDVITSGATAVQAATALLAGGAKSVDLMTLAQAPRWTRHRFKLFRLSRRLLRLHS